MYKPLNEGLDLLYHKYNGVTRYTLQKCLLLFGIENEHEQSRLKCEKALDFSLRK